MSSGGRIGNDAPYMPRGCDMRWFSTEEICEILGRFEKVIIIGDSMMRHIIGSINVLIRKDIGYGAVTDWNFSPEERWVCEAVEVCSSFRGPNFNPADKIELAGETVSATISSISKPAPFKGYIKLRM